MIIQQKYIRSLNKHLGQLMQGVDLVIGVPITQENNELVSRIGFSVPTEVGILSCRPRALEELLPTTQKESRLFGGICQRKQLIAR